MCNRARLDSDPETLREKFGAKWPGDVPNRWPIELTPNSRAPLVRSEASQRIIDLLRDRGPMERPGGMEGHWLAWHGWPDDPRSGTLGRGAGGYRDSR